MFISHLTYVYVCLCMYMYVVCILSHFAFEKESARFET